MIQWLAGQMDYLLFLRGLASLHLGFICALLARGKSSRLPWSWLALFGIFHGLFEWADLSNLILTGKPESHVWHALFSGLSFILLIEFGRRATVRLTGRRISGWATLLLVATSLIGWVGGSEGFRVASRQSLGVIGGFWASYALLMYAFREREAGWPYLGVASICLSLHAFADGLLFPSSELSAVRWLDADAFFAATGVPAPLISFLTYLAAAYLIWRYSRSVRARVDAAIRPAVLGYGKVVMIGVIVIIIAGGFLVQMLQGLIERTQRQSLQHFAAATSTLFEAGQLKALLQSREITDESLGDVRTTLRLVRMANPQLRFAALFEWRDGHIAFLADSEPPDSPDASPPGMAYESTQGSVEAGMASGRPFLSEIVRDAWGEWVCAFQPLWLEATGSTRLYLGLAVDARLFSHPVALYRLAGIMGTLVLYLLLLLIGLFVNLQEVREWGSAVADSERRFREIVQAASEGIIIVEPDTFRILDVNPMFLTWCSCERDQLVGFSMAELFRVPEQVLRKEFQELRKSPAHQLLRRHIRLPSGEERDVEISAIHMLYDGRDSVMAFVRDVTALRATEKALRESEERYALATQAGKVGVWDWTAGSDSFYLATGLRSQLGFSQKELPDRLAAWLRRVPAADRPELRRAIREHIRGRAAELVATFRLLARDGRVFWVMVRGGAERDAQGRLVRARGTLIDITDRQEAEEERSRMEAKLLHAQKLESLGVLAGGIAHDFNNILMAILGNVELAVLDAEPGGAMASHLENIKSAGVRAAELTNQMLAYSGKGRFVIELMQINTLIHEMDPLLRASVSRKAELLYELADSPPPILGDPTQIRQVIMNLVTNASDALEERTGRVTVSTGRIVLDAQNVRSLSHPGRLAEGACVFLRVADTGSGIDAPHRDKMFEPFFTTKFTGRGLGLAVVQGIVNGHQGGVDVRSALGRGTTFTVFFPAASTTAKDTAESGTREPLRAEEASGTVLVVDDEEAVRLVARKMLEKLGYQVLTAVDGRDGVVMLQRHAKTVGAILLDMTMPILSGEEAFLAMRAICPDVPVVLTSGYSEQEARGRFSEKGLSGFLQKPFKLSELAACLRQVIRPARPDELAAS